MNTATPAPTTLALPELCEAGLDAGILAQLFDDIAGCTEVLAVLPKFADRRKVAEQSVSLSEGRALLASGEARAIQIRYRYEGAEWWDTLMNTPQGTRLVRIRHEFE